MCGLGGMGSSGTSGGEEEGVCQDLEHASSVIIKARGLNNHAQTASGFFSRRLPECKPGEGL